MLQFAALLETTAREHSSDDSSGWMLPFAIAATVLFAVGLAVAWVLSKVGLLREKAAGS